MPRGFLRLYRTYNFIDKNPVIDKTRTIIQDEGLIKRLGIVHELSGVSVTTLSNWFNGKTRSPQHATIVAVTSSLGYEERFVKTKTFDIEAEREIAAAWQERQKKKAERAANGHGKKKR